MSKTYIPVALRRRVAARARNRCEYCLIHEDDTLLGCQVDHVISEKHGGATTEINLALSCAFCNVSKGSDVGSVLTNSEPPTFLRFFNPRTEIWTDHFTLDPADGVTIIPLTDIGRATERIFGFNRPERLLERMTVFLAGGYPKWLGACPASDLNAFHKQNYCKFPYSS